MLIFADHRRHNRKAEADRCKSYFQPDSNKASSEKCLAALAVLETWQVLYATNSWPQWRRTKTLQLRQGARGVSWRCWNGRCGRCACQGVWAARYAMCLCGRSVIALDSRRAPTCADEGGFYRVAVEDLMASRSAAKAQRPP